MSDTVAAVAITLMLAVAVFWWTIKFVWRWLCDAVMRFF